MPLADDAGSDCGRGSRATYKPLSLARHLLRKGRLPIDEALDIVERVLLAILHLHERGAGHCDVKPGNIIRIDSTWRLGDHGLITASEDFQSRGGTPAYWPPEGPKRHTVDLYAAGAMLFELVTGRDPLAVRKWVGSETEIPLAADSRGSAKAEGIIRRACTSDPARRYVSARDMLEAVHGAGRRVKLPLLVALAASLLVVAAVAAGAILRTTPPTSVIQAMTVEFYRGDPSIPLGELGLPIVTARPEDDVRVSARFSAPTFAYLIALNTDGSVELCHPSLDRGADAPATDFTYPSNPQDGFQLTEGPGVHAFALVTAQRRMPRLAGWLTDECAPLWVNVKTAQPWAYDGVRFAPVTSERGTVRRRIVPPEPFVRMCEALGTFPGVDAIHVYAFPVVEEESIRGD